MSKLITAAALLAETKHADQKRRVTGEPYIVHPMRVAGMTTLWVARQSEGMSYVAGDMIAAAWLHDVIEDANVTAEEIARATNGAVARYVLQLTNASMGSKEPRAVRKAMDREKLRAASREAKVIKMLDRIDNLTDMRGDPFAVKYAQESRLLVDVLRDADAELAERLGKLCLQMAQA
jgi:(p)ppGpp synthase/HD superfamily hydrolase